MEKRKGVDLEIRGRRGKKEEERKIAISLPFPSSLFITLERGFVRKGRNRLHFRLQRQQERKVLLFFLALGGN